MIAMCPHCGYNILPDAALVLGPWELTIQEARYKGAPAGLTPQQSAALYSIAKVAGSIISAERVGERISDTEDPRNLANVVIHKIRKNLGSTSPIETVWNYGYRWSSVHD